MKIIITITVLVILLAGCAAKEKVSENNASNACDLMYVVYDPCYDHGAKAETKNDDEADKKYCAQKGARIATGLILNKSKIKMNDKLPFLFGRLCASACMEAINGKAKQTKSQFCDSDTADADNDTAERDNTKKSVQP